MPSFFWNRTESGPRRIALLPLTICEGPYRLGAWLHRRAWAWSGRRVRLPTAVVSIGNLTVGGSGKTPAVAWLASELHARGRKVVVLSRGVRGSRSAQVNVVSDGERVLLGAAEAGDEPVLLASSVPGVPVLAGRNRVALGLRATALFGPEVLLLDDGFQHHRLLRDVDLVCAAAETAFGNGHVLPRGPLREPAGALAFADAFLWTRAPEGFDATAEHDPLLRHLRPDAARFALRIAPRGLRRQGAHEAPGLEGLETLRGREIGVLAALAQPDRLVADLERLGARIAARRVFADHHLYHRADLAGLRRDLLWVTTAKDAVKIPASWLEGLSLGVLEEGVVESEASGIVDWLLERLAGDSATDVTA